MRKSPSAPHTSQTRRGPLQSGAEALALASVVVDLRITQVANQVFGAHAVLPHGALTS